MPAYKLAGAPPMPNRGGLVSAQKTPPPGSSGMTNGGGSGMTNAPPSAPPSMNMGDLAGTVSRPPAADNKGYQSSPVSMAAGGPVINNKRNFVKNLPNPKDEFTGGRMPTKQTAPAKQDYGSKGKV